MNTKQPDAAGRETAEREAAWRRGEEFARTQPTGAPEWRDPRDTTQHGLAQRAFVALAENVRDYAVFLLDAEGIIRFWGEGARLIKWWTKEQAEGAHLRLMYPEGGSEDGTAEAHLQTAAETGEYSGEGHRIRSDGSMFWAGVTLTVLRHDSGEAAGFVKVTRDLTAQRAAEAMHRAALEAAEEASRMKSQFLATVSHEVRTPLTSVMAYTDLLKMELAGPLTEGQHRYLDTIRSSSQHLLGLIEDILDLSRSESGHIVVGRTSVRIGRVASQALMLVEPHAKRQQVQIIDAVSGAAAQHAFWGDEERVRQILLNLAGNAIKFTEPGGRVIVSAGTAAEPPPDAELDPASGPWIYVRVEDSGAGIPADRLNAIFEPFVQVDMSSTRRHGGTGLGLAISRSLARLMGGDITVRSEEGVGSTFFLWLPAALGAGSTAETEPAPALTPAGAGTLVEVREAVLADLERILHAYVARLRSDPETSSAGAVPEVQLEDHLASFLADIAQTLGSMDLAAGAGSELVRDGTTIQRTIAERHGVQRARLGWAETELKREFDILQEELAAAVRRRVSRPRAEEVEEVIGVLLQFLDRARTSALASYRRESSE